ncbi:sulfatase [Blastopirellula marina]|uniref:Sulfatase n=1 Tax=Blastopirellula marina TaxID=124 RepID=A0A2S8GCT0_9BACT|nr:sulfatase [Blastopirellula marina]PQO42257.1 sulfatase [Blastopirellula marina]
MRFAHLTIALLTLAATCPAVMGQDKAEPRHPNFVFFLVDDLGWTDIGVYGSSFYETPNVDRLAASGMRFTNAYAACQVCSPTRASIMTGRYPTRTGITDYIGAPQPEKWKRPTKMLPANYEMQLALDEVTIAEVLKENGYATFFAGKWHLGSEPYWPEHQGFDVNQGGIDRGGPYGGKKYFSPYGNPRLEDGPDGEHLPDRLAKETVKFITEHKDLPFLAYLSFYSVHTPLMSREDLKQKYLEKKQTLKHGEIWGEEGARKVRLVQEHAVYAGMVEAMDQAVGKVLTAVDDLGLKDDTVVIFMSDNGGLSTSEGHPTSNLPLRGGKGWIYEGGIREPMIVRWPGVTKADSVSEQYVSSVDFFPTMLEMAKIKVPQGLTIDGKSFAPVLEGKSIDRGPIFWHYPHYGNQGGSPSAAVRDGNWKLAEFYEDGNLELYNLSEDIGEQHNVAEDHPEIVKKLYAELEAWRKETGAKLPTHKETAAK